MLYINHGILLFMLKDLTHFPKTKQIWFHHFKMREFHKVNCSHKLRFTQEAKVKDTICWLLCSFLTYSRNPSIDNNLSSPSRESSIALPKPHSAGGELQSKWETNEMEENIQYWTSEFHCMNISGPLLKFRENERSMDSSNHQQTAHNKKSWTMCPLWSFTLFFSYKHFKPSNFDPSFTHHFPKCLIKIYCL